MGCSSRGACAARRWAHAPTGGGPHMCGPQTGPHAALSVVPHVARPPTIYARRMHYKRVIPCLDVDGGRVVKGVEFLDIRDAGDPVELAAHYDREAADGVVFLAITAQ